MMDPATVATLNALLRREACSLMQYARDAYPWATADEKEAVERLQQMSEEEREACEQLARLLIRRRLPLPHIGTYPASFTSLNFISLNKLIELLIAHHRRSIAQLQPELASVNDPDARLLVQRLLEMKERHLEELERLEAATKPAVVTA